MNRFSTLFLIGITGLLASCGSSVTSTTQPRPHQEFFVAMSPTQFTLNAGDFLAVKPTVELSILNSAPKPVAPQPSVKFTSSDSRVTISPAGEVCAGTWDTRFLTCTATLVPPCTPDKNGVCVPNPNAGQLDLPVGQVIITATDASHGVNGTSILTVHPRATSVSLTADWTQAKDANLNLVSCNSPVPGATCSCVSQNAQVQYLATPLTGANNINPSTCTPSNTSTCVVFPNDYTWVSADPNVAQVSSFGFVTARNPGVTQIFAKLNGTASAPISFAACPPKSLLLQSSPFTTGTPTGPFSTADLDVLGTAPAQCDPTTQACALTKGGQKIMTTSMVDTNGHPLVSSSLNFITSDPLTGNLANTLPLTSTLTASTSGRFTAMASCQPPNCNAAAADFAIPTPSGGAVPVHASSAGFGFPIYSNVIGVTVQGTTGSTVLVTNSATSQTDVTGAPAPLHVLLAYDSESMTVTHTITLANLPNSLVVAPNGAKAYLGSNDGLVVIDLASFQSSIQTFPVIGGISTDVVTGKVLGVSQDSRFVVVSDTSSATPANQLVFLIDTTGTKAAQRLSIPGIRAVTFAADGSNFWIAGDNGVLTFESDTFVHRATSNAAVDALAWTPDGQSYFAGGSQVVINSTCDDHQIAQSAGTPIDLEATVLGGVPHVFGLSGTQWIDYPVTTSAQAVNTPTGSTAGASGNVCNSTVTLSPPTQTPSNLPSLCTTPQPLQDLNVPQVSFTPTLIAGTTIVGTNAIGANPSAFVTGVNPTCTDQFIRGYNVSNHAALTLTPASSTITPLSGGILSDGRKLFVGTWDPTSQTGSLHRFDILAGTEDVSVPNVLTAPAPVELVPSFVAVVPK
jgi:hypothetical protein